MLIRRAPSLNASLILLVTLTCHSVSAEHRVWRDTTGDHSIEAEFVSLDDDVVTLRRRDGKLSRIARVRLSKADDAYLKRLLSRQEEEKEPVVPSYGNFLYSDQLSPVIKDLQETRRVSDGLNRYSFLSKVGGIAFDKSAQPKSHDLGKVISLAYSPNARDGSRFTAMVDGRTLSLPGHDWQLIPTLLYADSPYFSCFSLFGTTGDEEQDKELMKRYRYLCSYHPAFKNTLVGIRLMQMDSIFTDLNSYHGLPTNPRGKELLGAGEDQIRRPDDTYAKARALSELVRRYEYVAYVITDPKEAILFSVEDDAIAISGEPRFHFWKHRAGRDAIQENVFNQVARRLNVTRLSGGRIEASTKEALDKFNHEAAELIDTSLTEPVEPLDLAISAKIRDVSAINPVTYGAVRNVMRYAAFFRYCKQKNAEGFGRIVKEVARVTPTPAVITPNAVSSE